MDVSTGAAKLHQALKKLKQSWDTTQDAWTDAVRREFEEKHIALLEEKVKSTLREMDRLSQVMMQAHKECS